MKKPNAKAAYKADKECGDCTTPASASSAERAIYGMWIIIERHSKRFSVDCLCWTNSPADFVILHLLHHSCTTYTAMLLS